MKFKVPLYDIIKFILSVIFWVIIALNLTIFKEYGLDILSILWGVPNCILLLSSIKIIYYRKNNITVTADLMPPFWKVQYFTKIDLTNVVEIRLKKMNWLYSSRGFEKSGRGFERNRIGYHNFLEFIQSDGTVKRICTNYFMKYEIKKICKNSKKINDNIKVNLDFSK